MEKNVPVRYVCSKALIYWYNGTRFMTVFITMCYLGADPAGQAV